MNRDQLYSQSNSSSRPGSQMGQSVVNPATRRRIHLNDSGLSEYARWLDATEDPSPGYVKFKLLPSSSDPNQHPETFCLQDTTFTVFINQWSELPLDRFLVIAEKIRTDWYQEAPGQDMVPTILRQNSIQVAAWPKVGEYPFGEVSAFDLERAQRLIEQPFYGADLMPEMEEAQESLKAKEQKMNGRRREARKQDEGLIEIR